MQVLCLRGYFVFITSLLLHFFQSLKIGSYFDAQIIKKHGQNL